MKVCDFGASKSIELKPNSGVGTNLYRAPEVGYVGVYGPEVHEAKRRGLSCGIKGSTQTASSGSSLNTNNTLALQQAQTEAQQAKSEAQVAKQLAQQSEQEAQKAKSEAQQLKQQLAELKSQQQIKQKQCLAQSLLQLLHRDVVLHNPVSGVDELLCVEVCALERPKCKENLAKHNKS